MMQSTQCGKDSSWMREQNKHPSLLFLKWAKDKKSNSSGNAFGILTGKNKNKRERTADQSQEEEQIERDSFRRLIVLILSFVLGILIVLYFLSSLSKIGQISVSGTEEVIVQDVIDASSIHSGDSLWGTYLRKKDVEQEIETALPQVKHAALSLNGMNNFVIEVTEFQTVAYLANGQQYLKILENGKVLKEKQKDARGGYPIHSQFKVGKQLNR